MRMDGKMKAILLALMRVDILAKAGEDEQ